MSESKEYALSWSINHLSTIKLSKKWDLIISVKDIGDIPVSNYRYFTDTVSIHLLRNLLDQSKDVNLEDSTEENEKFKQLIPVDQKLYIPSLNHFSYFLKIEVEEDLSIIDDFFLAIRNSKHIQSIVKLDVNKIKEKEYFLF